ncbi:MAG: PAS domain S-box protein [Salinivirgaceae bacterium]|jgi:PAS domain S-box-containing protein|nr:PAS domain S-box protein [Salinivirgaceae bacterium]
MVVRNLQTELLLELVFSASNEIDEQLILKKSIPLYLRKLNCFLAGVLKNTNEGTEEIMVMPFVANKSGDWSKIKNYFKYKLPRESEPCIQSEFNNVLYYAFCLENYGLLILGRKKPFDDNLTYELKPVVNHLGKSLIRATEIEQRKKAEKSLIESEQRLRTLSHAITAGIFIYNDSGILFANPAAEQYTGYSNSTLLKMQFDHLIHPNFKSLFRENEAMESKGYIKTQFEVKIVEKNGSHRWLNLTKDIMQWQGGYATVISAFDITRRKQTEERLRESEQRLNLSLVVNKASVFENNYETGEVITTPDLYYSLGYLQSDIPVNMDDLIKFVHVDDIDQVTQTIEKYFKGETSEYYAEFRMRAKNGHYTWVNDRGKIVQRNDKGEPTVLLGISQDISNRKKVEKELVKAMDKAVESDRLKSAFLANMSHEIRTPLNSIIGFAQLLSENHVEQEDKAEYVNLIEQSGVRMLSIINDIIDISKIEAGQMEVYISDVRINEHIEYIYKLFKSEVDNNGIALSFRNGLSLNESLIKTDSEKLYAVLTNLVKNAIKFTDKGEINIGYKKKDNFLEFYVTDSGSGISAEQLESIFDRFIQGSQPLNSQYQGSGLGLSISKAYVELLGGKIWVESEVGKGTTFRFTMPIA